MATGTTCAAASRLISHTTRVGARDCISLSGSRWQSTPSRALRTHTSSISTTSLSSSRRICSAARAPLHSATSCAFRPPPRKHITSPTRRTFASSTIQRHGDITPPKPGEERKVTFVDKEGRDWTFEVADGDNLLDIAQANDLEMEGACGGSCACSTCHVIVADDALYDKMEEPSDDENDMLDLAFGLTETSRLGCQVVMSKELDGLVVKLPSMTRNLQASDFAEKK